MTCPNIDPDDTETIAKMDSCVEQVMAKDGSLDKSSAIAICYTQIVEGKALLEQSMDALKVGRRNNAQDQERLQQIHDFAVENGAQCKIAPEVTETPLGEPITAMGKSSAVLLISSGGAVKAVDLGNGKTEVGGYLVTFGDDTTPDLSPQRDYFDKQTDFRFTFPGKSATYFNHTMPVTADGKQIAISKPLKYAAELTLDDIGVFAKALLDERDEYEKYLAKLAKQGILGWSSGTAEHLVRRTPTQNGAHHIDVWPLGLDASLTHTPADYRNQVLPLKSLSVLQEQFQKQFTATPGLLPAEGAQNAPPAQQGTAVKATQIETNPNIMEATMEDEKLKVLLDETAAKAATAAIKAYQDLQPVSNPVQTAVKVTLDEADKPFLTLSEQCRAVKAIELSHGQVKDARLNRLAVKASGASEGIPADGGYLLEPTLTTEILKPLHEEGPFSKLVRKLPVSANSNYGWINGVDETDRATGSRWGGIRGYRLAEAETITTSRPKFRRINWELKKYAIATYATDEQLADSTQFSEIVRIGAGEELSFMANDDILNGLGTGGALGILGTTGPCYVSVAKDTGQKAATVTYQNLINMWARLSSRSKPKANWFINTDVNPQLDSLAIEAGAGALEPRFIGYDQSGVLRIKGRPVIETEFNATLGTLGDIVLADMNEYLFWEKGGVQSAMSVHIAFLSDETVFKFIYRSYGCPSIATPTTPYKGTNTLSPFVVLAARA